MVPDRAEQAAEGDEHGREAEHEHASSQQQAALPASAGRADVGAAHAGHVREVAGYEWQHARREERHQPGEHGRPEREQDAAVERSLAEVLPHGEQERAGLGH